MIDRGKTPFHFEMLCVSYGVSAQQQGFIFVNKTVKIIRYKNGVVLQSCKYSQCICKDVVPRAKAKSVEQNIACEILVV